MHILALDDTNQPAALSYLRRAPYRNGILLSNVTQLRTQCDVLVAFRAEQVVGVATHYRPLPFLNLVFAVDHDGIVPALLAALVDRVPRLHNASIVSILPEVRVQQLAPYVHVDALEFELQMAVEPETLRDRPASHVRRLTASDLPAMQDLAQAASLTAWVDDTLQNGPAFGAFVNNSLVSMAGTHYATTDVIEIGHIATHPAHRRQGHAAACVAALCKVCIGLAPRVYLMVLEHNTPALATYRSLGFQPIERFGLVTYQLSTSAEHLDEHH